MIWCDMVKNGMVMVLEMVWCGMVANGKLVVRQSSVCLLTTAAPLRITIKGQLFLLLLPLVR